VSSEAAAREPAGVARWAGGTVDFLRAVRTELGKVTWPSRDELTKATRMIVVLSIVLGLAIGWMDLLLNLVLVDGVAALSR
jgi:preprotein translocase SecE subunit